MLMALVVWLLGKRTGLSDQSRKTQNIDGSSNGCEQNIPKMN
jgi:hypothetical protein